MIESQVESMVCFFLLGISNLKNLLSTFYLNLTDIQTTIAKLRSKMAGKIKTKLLIS